MVINQFPARFAQYILLDRINAGGMAEVFRAKVTGAEGFERLVAIKCMLPQLMADEQFIAMFKDEAKLAAQLGHANIVQIYELGRVGERLYIAMELISGRDLRHVVRAAKAQKIPVPPGFAAYVINRAAQGLDYAHRKVGINGQPLNLVHRDVSPQNILLSYEGEVKVVDFGIAKAEARSTETQAGVLKGKFAYMAPEQVMGGHLDRRVDIFALGNVLFELATSQRLFTGENDLAVLDKVRLVKLPDLERALPPGSEALLPVLQQALAKKPEDRFAYASDLADALERVLVGPDRNLFGTKQAAAFMRQLYADDMVHLADQLRHFASISAADCVQVIGQEATPQGSERFFETSFSDTPSLSAQPTTHPKSQGRTTHSGLKTRPSERVLVDSDSSVEGDSAGRSRRVTSAPRSTHGGSHRAAPEVLLRARFTLTDHLLRLLLMVLFLCALLTSSLMLMVSTRQMDPATRAQIGQQLGQALGWAQPAWLWLHERLPRLPGTAVPAGTGNGFVLVAAGRRGHVLVDDRPVTGGQILRLPIGQHTVRIVEEDRGRSLVRYDETVAVTLEHTSAHPLRVP